MNKNEISHKELKEVFKLEMETFEIINEKLEKEKLKKKDK